MRRRRAGRRGELRGPVVVPFAGAAHDWTAVEIGAWLARNSGEPLRLAVASTSSEGRDANRLLASASLAVQHCSFAAACAREVSLPARATRASPGRWPELRPA
jgi:hypothetical protein